MFLSSLDKRVGEDARKCTYTGFNEIAISSIGLTDYEFVTQFDNINDSNNTAYIDDGSTTYPITIANGQYTGTTLAAAVKAAVDTATAPIVSTITYADDRFTHTATAPIKWLPNPTGRKDFALMMGVLTDDLSVSIDGTLANLVYTNKLFITSRALTRRAILNDYSSNNQVSGVLGVVYLHHSPTTAAFRTVREIENVKYISTDPTNTIRDIDIEILDEAGNEIPDDQAENFSYDLSIAVSRSQAPDV